MAKKYLYIILFVSLLVKNYGVTFTKTKQTIRKNYQYKTVVHITTIKPTTVLQPTNSMTSSISKMPIRETVSPITVLKATNSMILLIANITIQETASSNYTKNIKTFTNNIQLAVSKPSYKTTVLISNISMQDTAIDNNTSSNMVTKKSWRNEKRLVISGYIFITCTSLGVIYLIVSHVKTKSALKKYELMKNMQACRSIATRYEYQTVPRNYQMSSFTF